MRFKQKDYKPQPYIFRKSRKTIEKYNFNIVNEDQTRPWGGFFVIEEAQASDLFLSFFNT